MREQIIICSNCLKASCPALHDRCCKRRELPEAQQPIQMTTVRTRYEVEQYGIESSWHWDNAAQERLWQLRAEQEEFREAAGRG